MSKVAVSLLSLEHKKRVNIANKLLLKGMKWIHYDLMDGNFVSNTAISIKEMKEIIEQTSSHIIDAHFMVKNPEHWIELSKDFIDYATFHFEAINEIQIKKIIKKYKGSLNIGLAINPKTPPQKIVHLLPLVNHILIMSVEPGRGGQKFDLGALDKIKFLKKQIIKKNLVVSIGVDGGINNLMGPLAIKAGADILVSGTYLTNSPNKKTLLQIEGK